MKGGRRSGAGRLGRYATTAGKHQLDVRKLHRGGYLLSHHWMTWVWEGGAAIHLVTSPEAITLIYRYKDNNDTWRYVDQRVNITRTLCHYGGNRPWFQCPYCLRRVAIIYLWNVPLCRKCAELAYSSQSQDAIGRSWRRTQKIERKLAGRCEKWTLGKPKGMRVATYDRLLQAYRSEDDLRDEALVALFSRHYPDLLD